MSAKGRTSAGRARSKKRAGVGKVALVRALSKLGYASRSQAYELIRAGRVEVNGRPASDPALHVVPGLTRIEVSGAEVTREPWVCIALNKPRKVVTTRSDPEARPTVYDLIADVHARVVPVGRLDLASTGLLLMTSDTTLADWLTEYRNRNRAPVRRHRARRTVGRFGAGPHERRSRRGETLAAAAIEILKRSKRETHLIVELTEGRNREIRRMLKAAGHEVTRLKRIAFGGIELGSLGPGKWRNVSADELRGAFPKAPLRAI